MKKRVGVITGDRNLYNKIRLLLRADATVELITEGASTAVYDLIFKDVKNDMRTDAKTLTVGDGGDIPFPFRHESIIDALDDTDAVVSDSITLADDGKHVYIGGEAVKLTGVEYALLDYVMKADGFASREDILANVWGDGFDRGVVNVYIHYLRKKIEKDGRKVIISSRTEGYKIDERYRSNKQC